MITYKPLSGSFNKLPVKTITTAVDTEYVQVPEQPNKMLTTQLAFSPDDCLVLEHPTNCFGVLPTWNTRCILSSVLGVPEITLQSQSCSGYLIWEVLMFFAPADLLAGLFNDINLCRYIQRNCKQDARIRIDTGKRRNSDLLPVDIYLKFPEGIYQLVLKVVDFGKLTGRGLAATVEAFNGKMLSKSIMDKYKTNMEVPYRDENLISQFIEYAKDDALQLWFLREANALRTKKLFETHDLEVPEKEITTTGTLVSKLFEAYLNKHIGENKAYKYFTDTKVNGKTKTYKLNDLLEKSTVKYFAKLGHSRKQVSALVQGGRAKNERPTVVKATGVIADPDLSSCYVTILKNMVYPVGLPCSYGQHESSKKKRSLGWFLDKFGNELEPRLYAITVSGKLKHHQTLVPSKVIDTLEVSEKYDEDNPKIPADFRLYTKEIINGVITSDVLEVLKNVCSKKELNQWLKLEVVSAVWYPKSKRCETPQEWVNATHLHVQGHGNEVETKVSPSGKETVKDNRSRYWLAVPINDFLKPYADERSRLKKLRNEQPKGSELYNSYNAQQEAFKLVGNTLYGVLASPYFDIGNVCIANNITAAARVAVWATATATGAFQSITDGGAFDLNKVRDWVTKPTMDTLALWRNTKQINKNLRGNLIEKPLNATHSWELSPGKTNEHSIVSNGNGLSIEAKSGQWDYFDKALLEHVKHFFRDAEHQISILNLISYEHKDIYKEIIIHSQTNYRFQHISGEYKIKARGHKVKGTPYNGDTESSNINLLFDHLKEDPTKIPPYSPQTISQILKCNQANEMLLSKTDNTLKENNLLAGDTILKRSWLRPISLSMFHWQSDDQYKAWSTKAESLKNRTGYGLEQFFMDEATQNVNYQRAITIIQARIDAGEDWIVHSKGRNFVGVDHVFANTKN